MANTIELAQTGKRDHLISLEKKYQAMWASDRLFETDPPTKEELAGLTKEQIKDKYPKWMGVFPYPYTNGSLHLGHAFTISKIEFNAGYQRMLGKRVLFPHGFHVTGMPIKAAADRIVREMELFGPDFEGYEKALETAASIDSAEDNVKKEKASAPAAPIYQFQIMESMGIPRSEIKKFADSIYWTKYFPPIAKEDNLALGTRVDWRRSMLTTELNPYYDSFVRWQFRKLYKLGKVKFGERYTIYSPKDRQPCMDHDRSEGEALGPQEYTAIKMEVLSWSPAAKNEIEEAVGGRKVFLVAATLRTETMYGQTNCFVGTSINYIIFAVNDKEAYLCTARAARNMSFQGVTPEQGQVEKLMEINGAKLVGTKIKAPFSIAPEVYVLPMENVLATKGTGVVTSVPSDSPDDYQTLLDLRKKPDFYKIDPSWVAIDPIPVLTTPAYGNLTALAVVQQLKIQSQKDTKQLAEAKEIVYKEGFYTGTMLVGEFKGMPVQDAKPKVRAAMISAGVAFPYAEPEGLVISRSQDECVVALMDQWYLDYGESGWRAETERMLAGMNLYTAETRHAFEGTLAWLNQWACARSFGLGTKLPWDPSFLVESLSDSTVYMSYYTVCHLLQSEFDGSKPGLLGITPDQMTDEIWEWLLADGPWPSGSALPREKADILKHQYEYFYPFNIRSSAKDLIPNHLTFCLYSHAALFPEHKWPLSIRINGYLMLNGKKMSKSTGNSLTLREGVDKFGADAMRLTLADAGDGIEDANFEEKTANANILRVHTLLGWCEDMVAESAKLRQGPRNYHDRIFEEEIKDLINITQSHYEATNYKDAMKYGFYEFQTARDWYREVTSDIGMHSELVLYWIRCAALLATPIAPHFAEHIWMSILKNTKSIQLASWPTPTEPVDRTIVEAGEYMRETVKGIRDAETVLVKKLSKSKDKGKAAPFDPKKPRSVRIYVATSFPAWQNQCVQAVKDGYSEATQTVDDVRVREALAQAGLLKDKRAMPFVQAFKKRIAQFGAETAFRRTLPFSEVAVLNDYLPYVKKTLGLVDAEVLTVEEAKTKVGQPGFTLSIIETSEPGNPACEYRNV